MKFLKSTSLAILSLIIIGLLACQVDFSMNKKYRGEGSVINQTMELSKVSGVELVGSTNVFISYGEKQKVSVKGHGNIIDRLEVKVKRGVAHISLKDGSYNDYELNVHIILPYLETVNITGSGDIMVSDFENIEELEAAIIGSGEVEVKNCKIENLEVEIIGSGDFTSKKSIAKNADIEIVGSGDAVVYVTKNLKASISGSGDIEYIGDPKVESDVSGSGEVSKKRKIRG
ncbi:MAG: hypothetical protein ACI9G9_000578 [Psychromonas sp.]|jgi:hypothetical protein